MRTFQPSAYSYSAPAGIIGDFGTAAPAVPGTSTSPVPDLPKKPRRKKRRPLWVLPTIVGSSVLGVGLLVTFFVYRSKKKKALAGASAPSGV
jgi:hypothetical protein